MSDPKVPVKTVGLVIPTYWEGKDLFKRFNFKPTQGRLLQTGIGGKRVLARISGVGHRAASKAAELLVSSGAQELISVGFCGALVPSLLVGDLVTDRITSSDKPIRTPKERLALTARLNAVAVDMETRAVVEAGTRLGVPIRVLRVVSDEFTDDLTPLFGASGSFSAWGIAIRLLNPAVWPLARKLKAQSAVARQRLGLAVEEFFQAK